MAWALLVGWRQKTGSGYRYFRTGRFKPVTELDNFDLGCVVTISATAPTRNDQNLPLEGDWLQASCNGLDPKACIHRENALMSRIGEFPKNAILPVELRHTLISNPPINSALT